MNHLHDIVIATVMSHDLPDHRASALLLFKAVPDHVNGTGTGSVTMGKWFAPIPKYEDVHKLSREFLVQELLDADTMGFYCIGFVHDTEQGDTSLLYATLLPLPRDLITVLTPMVEDYMNVLKKDLHPENE
jgi:hypothetical protein